MLILAFSLCGSLSLSLTHSLSLSLSLSNSLFPSPSSLLVFYIIFVNRDLSLPVFLFLPPLSLFLYLSLCGTLSLPPVSHYVFLSVLPLSLFLYVALSFTNPYLSVYLCLHLSVALSLSLPLSLSICCLFSLSLWTAYFLILLFQKYQKFVSNYRKYLYVSIATVYHTRVREHSLIDQRNQN